MTLLKFPMTKEKEHIPINKIKAFIILSASLTPRRSPNPTVDNEVRAK